MTLGWARQRPRQICPRHIGDGDEVVRQDSAPGGAPRRRSSRGPIVVSVLAGVAVLGLIGFLACGPSIVPVRIVRSIVASGGDGRAREPARGSICSVEGDALRCHCVSLVEARE